MDFVTVSAAISNSFHVDYSRDEKLFFRGFRFVEDLRFWTMSLGRDFMEVCEIMWLIC